jgi:Pyruvate/2-oxoacid:ferredoxin oxidoreductase gamma subunit
LVTTRMLPGATQRGIPATTRAIEELNQKQVANIVMLAAAVAATEMVSREAVLAAIESTVDEKFRAADIRSAELGFSLGEQS